MKRLFWLTVGAGAGVYATHRVKRRVERLAREWSPEGVAARATRSGQDAGRRVRDLVADVRSETAAREAELREAIRLDRAASGPDATTRPRVLRIDQARYSVHNDDKDGH